MNPVILGISGKRESGKSLLASYLEHYHGWVRFSLADELKKKCMADFKLLPNQLWGKEKETPTGYRRTNGSNWTARDILIRVGEVYRSVDQLFWCRKFDPRIGDFIVCDDIRFENEVRYFKSTYQTKFVRLERYQELCPHKAALDDYSEQDLDKFKDWDFKLNADLNKTAADLKQYAEYLDDRARLAF